MEYHEMNKMTYNNRHENAYCISLAVHKYYILRISRKIRHGENEMWVKCFIEML